MPDTAATSDKGPRPRGDDLMEPRESWSGEALSIHETRAMSPPLVR